MPMWAEPAWRAWNELSSERAYAVVGYSVPMGAMLIQSRPCPIPWSAMHAWCDRARCAQIDREFIVPLVMALDRELIAHWQRQQKAAQNAAPPAESKLARWDSMEEKNDGW